VETILSRHWHHLPEEEVLDLLESDRDSGLDILDVEDRQRRFGPNAIAEKEGQGPVERFLTQLRQPLMIILLVAALITAVLGEWVDSTVILGVVLVTAIIGFIQETKAHNAIRALAQYMGTEATVVRAGQRTRIPAPELVPGDIVLLQSGDKVPADLRLLAARDLYIDESSLTGESVPVDKAVMVLDHTAVLADRRNMTYMSTLVTYGRGTGIIVAIGDDTEIGRISELISSTEKLATPLTRRIAQFSHVLLFAILGLAGLTFLVGILRGEPLVDMFMAAVALAVGAIPEGLPAAVTITLAIGVGRMAKRNSIIRSLPAVETLGSTTVICSDKTGTLTQNQMTVQQAFAGGGVVTFSGLGWDPDGTVMRDGVAVDAHTDAPLVECLRAGLLANESGLLETDEGWRAEGDPTEVALIVAGHKAGLDPRAVAQVLPRLDVIPFESQHQYMATLHEASDGRPAIAYVKGAPEAIFERCTRVLGPTGDPESFDRSVLESRVAAMASEGLRVLAFARLEFPAGTRAIHHEDVSQGLTFLGLQGMMDPPRVEAAQSIAECREAGIHVKMITGDHADTAAEIARQLNLDGTGLGGRAAEGAAPSVITGAQMNEISDSELVKVAHDTAVFARVAPEQKLRLVEALQHRGDVVAMTGDGVNDAPALRRADIGVSMGIAGTEVAKEAADMVLTDDDFSSIVAAVEEGRGVFANLTKFITWTLPTNVGEGLVILLAVFLGATLPILPVQILWINMTTALLLGLMLAFEPKEKDIMLRPPRDPASPILSRALLVRILIVGILLLIGAFGLFEWALSQGVSVEVARTIAVNVFVFGELFYLFNCRSLTRSMFAVGVFSNRWLWTGVSVMIVLQLAFTYVPLMNTIFNSAPIDAVWWLSIIGVGLGIYIVVETEKWLRRRLNGSSGTPGREPPVASPVH
jgi:cation-transporting P-type ATPase F